MKRGWFGEFGPDVFGLVLAGSTMLGLGQHAKTLENRCRKGRCLLNLPLLEIATAVDRLALSTGKLEMPDHKVRLGFRYA